MPFITPPAPAALTLIGSTTLGSAAASISFSSIASGYKGFVIFVTNAKASANTPNLCWKLNADGGNNYSQYTQYNGGAWAKGAGIAPPYFMLLNATDLGCAELHISNSSTLTKNAQYWGGSINTEMSGFGMWNNTDEITTITLITTSDQIAAGCTVFLYGYK